jgi:hypothetical protein
MDGSRTEEVLDGGIGYDESFVELELNTRSAALRCTKFHASDGTGSVVVKYPLDVAVPGARPINSSGPEESDPGYPEELRYMSTINVPKGPISAEASGDHLAPSKMAVRLEGDRNGSESFA